MALASPHVTIDNRSQPRYLEAVTDLSLVDLPRRATATVATVDWTRLAVPEARRLRELGFDEGVDVEVLHRATFGRGPIACRIGRMTVALRRSVAASIRVALPQAAE